MPILLLSRRVSGHLFEPMRKVKLSGLPDVTSGRAVGLREKSLSIKSSPLGDVHSP